MRVLGFSSRLVTPRSTLAAHSMRQLSPIPAPIMTPSYHPMGPNAAELRTPKRNGALSGGVRKLRPFRTKEPRPLAST